MKFTCSKEKLSESIGIVQKAVSSKTTLPILEGILLECSDKGLKLTGNDLEIGIECLVESDIRETGSIVLNSKMFGDIVRRLPDSEVMIQTMGDGIISIDCLNSHFELKGQSSESFPAIPLTSADNAHTISQKILRDMIRQTLFSVGIDEKRPILMGSLIESKDNELTVVSIDGFRLALRKNIIEGLNENFSVVVPGKTLNEIVKILQPVDDNVLIYADKNLITFQIDNTKMVSRLIEGEYMNYHSILPTDFECKFVANTKDMLSSIERASLIAMDDKKYPIKFNITNESLVISSNTSIGNVREEIVLDIDGNNIEIGFNPRYFIEALKVIEDESVEIHLTSSVGPCTIGPVNGKQFTYMILPVRIKSEDYD